MWSSDEHDEVVKALAVVCEVTGTQVSPGAAQLMVRQLGMYPYPAVIRALERCALECKYRLSLADIVERIDDTRPSADEAWGMVPKTEDAAGVVTEEMMAAWGAARLLYADGDKVGARMAFRERYETEVRNARTEGRPAYWRVTAGWDRLATEGACIEAMRRKLVPVDAALALIEPDRHDAALQAAGVTDRLLPPPNPDHIEAKMKLAAAVQAIAHRKGA